MRDLVVVGLLVLAFATLATSHASILWALTRRRPRVHALVALVVPPLAPYLAWRERLRFRTWVWIGSALAYALARALAWHA